MYDFMYVCLYIHMFYVYSGAVVKEIVKEADGTMTVHLENGSSYPGFDCLLGATGRSPLTQTLGIYMYVYMYTRFYKYGRMTK